jgi:TonB family protein
MSCPDPYRPYNPFGGAPDANSKVQSALPSDAEIRGLTSALAAIGGGEASEDLALDLVLNQIVEQACLATGATGAAIALTRNGEMVCRATTGRNAPDLGVRLDNAGFSAECLRVGTLQRCDDTETDPRVDPSACRLLGVRSILVVPLWYWGEFMGIFEIFSPRPNAFGERDEQTLQALAYRVVRHTKESSGRLTGFTAGDEEMPAVTAPPPEIKPEPIPEPLDLRSNIVELKPRPTTAIPHDRWMTFLIACAALMAGIIVGLMLWRLGGTRTTAHKGASVSPAPQSQELDLNLTSAISSQPAPKPEDPVAETSPRSATKSPSNESVSAADVLLSAAAKNADVVVSPAGRKEVTHSPQEPGGLAIYDKGKLIYGTPLPDPNSDVAKPVAPKPTSSKLAPPKSAALLAKSIPADAPSNLLDGSFVRLKPELAESLLADRVEPEYPDAARRAHIQGAVTLETLINANGKVQQVTPVAGSPELADAAVNAVRQWRYKPFTVDGKKVPIRTQVTVTFMLAQ